jgi:hypothetical protein
MVNMAIKLKMDQATKTATYLHKHMFLSFASSKSKPDRSVNEDMGRPL